MMHRRNLAPVEFLEPRHLLAGDPLITEFMAKNDGFLEDGDGDAPDWIEIQNVGDSTLDLAGYRLTDTPSDMSRWVFPSVNLDPGEYLVVFASGKGEDDYVDPNGNLHTNFSLSAGGEYLALVGPDGTLHSEFGTTDSEFPEQTSNVSFGVPQRSELLDGRSDAAYWQPLGDDVDSVWTATDFDAAAHGFLPGQAAMGYEDKPESRNNFTEEILTVLPSGIQGIYSRLQFDLEDSAEVTRLKLRLKYDNGFIAYLNGVKVAEANAPADPQWYSPALERSPSDGQALEFAEFDLTPYVPQLVDGTNVLALHGLNHLSDRDDMLLVPELTASIHRPDATPGYMTEPTPGAENVGVQSVMTGFLGETKIMGEPGFHDAPFTVTVSTETPDAELRFTTDGRPPTATTGTPYSGPISIDTTTTLRAAAFKEGHIPSNVATQTYLFLDDVIRQSQEQPGLPTEWLWTGDRNYYPADYEMDPTVVDDPAYRDEIIDSLKSLRTMSVVMDPDDLFGPEGMVNNTELHGSESEHPMSLEILNPDGSLAKQVDAGIRVHGAWTRHYDYNLKLSFRLSFRGEYGATTLEYPLFPDSPASEFDNIVLHSGRNRDDAQLVSNSFARDTNRAIGNLDAHSTYVHLYLNGLYWGLYNPFERIDSQFAERYLGGLDTDYFAIAGEGTAVAIDGTIDRFNRMMNSLGDVDTKEEYEDFLTQVDLDGLLDFILINQYMAHREHEFRAIGNREGDANIRFMVWDVDEVSMQVNGRTPIDTYFTPSSFYRDLTTHPEIRLRFADRIYKHLFNDGVLTPESARERWEARARMTRPAVIAESARWGDMLWENAIPRTLYSLETYDAFAERMESFFPSRTGNLFRDLASIYPDVDAPRWNQFGGPVPDDFQLTMTHPNPTGMILYTLDGTDPRRYGGEVSPSAIIYDGPPVIISDDTVVKARVLSDGEWSALAEGDFFVVGPDSPFHLRVTEINYHPHDANPVPGMGEANVDNSQFEFVEITNTSTAPVDLSGVQLVQGLSFTFPDGAALDAGKQTVVVKNRQAFESRYGTGLNIAGQFEGTLADSQRSFELRDATGRSIQGISYGTLDNWPQRANGLGSSLEIIDPFNSAREASSWRASNQFGGSPGVAHLDSNDVVITEVLAHPPSQGLDRVELHNTSSAEVDVSHWYISSSDENYFQHQVSTGTTIASGGYHVIDQTDFGFDLSGSRGDQLWLIAADATGKPLRFADHIQFGPSGESVSLGSAPDGTWLPLAEQTFGRANSRLLPGDAIISEVHYAPLDPDGDRRLLHADDFEFIELYNRTDASLDVSNWQISGSAEFTLPAGTVIESRQSLLLVPFDPAGMVDAPIFRVTYDVDSSVPLLGPYAPVLSDDGGAIRVERPDVPPAEDPTLTPYLYVDEMNYEATAPWPTTVVSTGSSLTRVSAESFGNLPTSWTAQSASPGSADFVLRLPGDANGDGQFNQLDLVEVLQGGKYQTGQPASFREGDWNEDGVFDQLDLVAALQTGNYLGGLAARGDVKTVGEAGDVFAGNVDQVVAQWD